MSERLTPEDVAAIEEACRESYRQCVADRRARIERVIAENPTAGPTELAEKANVSRQAIHNHKRAAAEGVNGFTTRKMSNLPAPRPADREVDDGGPWHWCVCSLAANRTATRVLLLPLNTIFWLPRVLAWTKMNLLSLRER